VPSSLRLIGYLMILDDMAPLGKCVILGLHIVKFYRPMTESPFESSNENGDRGQRRTSVRRISIWKKERSVQKQDPH
jgi:hypothetical protein